MRYKTNSNQKSDTFRDIYGLYKVVGKDVSTKRTNEKNSEFIFVYVNKNTWTNLHVCLTISNPKRFHLHFSSVGCKCFSLKIMSYETNFGKLES